jgi:hypothetical protein
MFKIIYTVIVAHHHKETLISLNSPTSPLVHISLRLGPTRIFPHKELYFPGYKTVYSVESESTFRRNMSPYIQVE